MNEEREALQELLDAYMASRRLSVAVGRARELLFREDRESLAQFLLLGIAQAIYENEQQPVGGGHLSGDEWTHALANRLADELIEKYELHLHE